MKTVVLGPHHHVRRPGASYQRVNRSELLGANADELHGSIHWPGDA